MITIFVHVPKTAGTTLKVMAEDAYRPDEILAIYADDIPRARQVVAEQSPEAVARLKLIRGHFAYGIHEELPSGIPYQYITMLRDPVTRVESLYKYIIRSKGHHLHERIIRTGITGFVTSGLSAEASNGMVHQLCGTLGEFPQEPNIVTAAPGIDDLLQAASNIDKFAFVGLTEEFDTSITALRDLLDWPVKEYDKENVSRPYGHMTEADRLTVWHWNALDRALYYHARIKWGQR